MRRIALVAIATVGLAAPALAADLSPDFFTKGPSMVAAAYDWSGLYLGANGGWSGDRKCWTNNGAAVDVGCGSGNGGVAGGQIGYRWQASNWVFGLEAQGDWANLKSSKLSLVDPLVTNQSQVNAFGLFTGQAGYAWNSALFYVRGGAAVAADKYDGMGTATGIVFDRASETRWVALSAPVSTSASLRTGRLGWDMTICLWVAPTTASSRLDWGPITGRQLARWSGM